MADPVSKVFQGDCLEVLGTVGDNSMDSLVTDPPAGIGFMGKNWDSDKGGREQWVSWLTEVMTECLRVLKPGAHALVWAIPRTSHWTMTALENAGFEIRDVVTHLFGTGFPKSLDVSKAIDKEAGAKREVVGKGKAGKSSIGQETRVVVGARPTVRDGSDFNITAPATDAARQWEGFGTALKPACEFWILCRKPISEKTVAKNVLKWGTGAINVGGCRIEAADQDVLDAAVKRMTGNITQHAQDRQFLAGTKTIQPKAAQGRFPANLVFDEEAAAELDKQRGSEGGGASRFFYVAKASKSDRGEGNTHPTVKSTKLMTYLVRLVTPPGGTVLDPFMGSGSTGVAAKAEGMGFVGVEKEPSYFEMAGSRLKRAD